MQSRPRMLSPLLQGGILRPCCDQANRREIDMWKSNKSRAEQHFASTQKKDDKVLKQKEKTQRERDERMARLRDLRLAKEAAEQTAAEPPASEQEAPDRLPKVHPHQS
ncbi:MAG: hypothetical protein ACFCUT_01560 [Kiloniellaceae bacterium]